MKRIVMGGAAIAVLAGTVWAADAGVQRKIFDRMDVPAGYEAVVGGGEFPPGMSIGRHSHHGTEFAYVVTGEVEFTVEGQPPQRVTAGNFYRIDAGKVHDARNVGTVTAKSVSTWIIEKGKPLAEPAK